MRGQCGDTGLNQRRRTNRSGNDISRCGRQAHTHDDAGQHNHHQHGEQVAAGYAEHDGGEFHADARHADNANNDTRASTGNRDRHRRFRRRNQGIHDFPNGKTVLLAQRVHHTNR